VPCRWSSTSRGRASESIRFSYAISWLRRSPPFHRDGWRPRPRCAYLLLGVALIGISDLGRRIGSPSSCSHSSPRSSAQYRSWPFPPGQSTCDSGPASSAWLCTRPPRLSRWGWHPVRCRGHGGEEPGPARHGSRAVGRLRRAHLPAGRRGASCSRSTCRRWLTMCTPRQTSPALAKRHPRTGQSRSRLRPGGPSGGGWRHASPANGVAEAIDLDGHLAEYGALATTLRERELAASFAGQWHEVHTLGAALLEAGIQAARRNRRASPPCACGCINWSRGR